MRGGRKAKPKVGRGEVKGSCRTREDAKTILTEVGYCYSTVRGRTEIRFEDCVARRTVRRS